MSKKSKKILHDFREKLYINSPSSFVNIKIKEKTGLDHRYLHDIIRDIDIYTQKRVWIFKSKAGEVFWKSLTLIGSPYFWFFIIVFLGIFRFFSIMLLLVLALSSSILLVYLLKNIFKRSRPYERYPHLKALEKQKGFSFPSGHTYIATICLTVIGIFYLDALFFMGALIIGIMVGISRMYLGVHYFSDIIAGYLLAIGFAIFLALIFPFFGF